MLRAHTASQSHSTTCPFTHSTSSHSLGHTPRTHPAVTHSSVTSQEIADSSTAVTAALRGGLGVTHPHTAHAGSPGHRLSRTLWPRTPVRAHTRPRSLDALASQAALSPVSPPGHTATSMLPLVGSHAVPAARGVTHRGWLKVSHSRAPLRGDSQSQSPTQRRAAGVQPAHTPPPSLSAVEARGAVSPGPPPGPGRGA